MIITLLSDAGTKDATIALMKVALLRHLPGAAVVDVGHHVVRHSQRQAAYLLRTFFRSFPPGTIHICPVAVFVGKAPAMLLGQCEGHYFIAPDNGLLPLALPVGKYATRLCHSYARPQNFAQWMEDAAEVAAFVSQGVILPGKPIVAQELKQLPPPQISPIGLECQVLYTDRYGNVVLNITEQEFVRMVADRPFRIQTIRGQNVTAISRHYSDVPADAPLCRFNNAGLLEVAVNHGAATDLLGFEPDDVANLRYGPVRIFV